MQCHGSYLVLIPLQNLNFDLLFYASSNAVCCYKNPLVQEALKQINITPPPMDFYKDMKDFLKMRLEWKEDF